MTANVARSPEELEIQARGERPADVAARAEEAALAAEDVFEGEAPEALKAGAEPEAAPEQPAPETSRAARRRGGAPDIDFEDNEDEDGESRGSRRSRPRQRR